MKHIYKNLSLLLFSSFVWLFSITAAYGQWSTDPGVNNIICDTIIDQIYPKTVSDGYGGAIITWQDNLADESNIYIQRINSTGFVQWTVNGLMLCNAPGNQIYPTLASDGSGGAIITWEDLRDINHKYDIYSQRISSSGVAQWTPNGVPITSLTSGQYNPIIISDGLGGAFITWIDFRGDGSSANIYAQKINSAGEVQWPVNGVALSNVLGIKRNVNIVKDGSGGAIIAWEDERLGGFNENIYAQRINSSGKVQWLANGVAITNTLHCVKPGIVSDGSGGAIITWQDFRNTNNYHVYAQKIDSTGTLKWTTNGVSVSTSIFNENHPAITSDGSGGAIITWEDFQEGEANSDLYSQRISSSGSMVWNENGVAVCTATGYQGNQTSVSDGAGGVVITWPDTRDNNTAAHIYSQKINSSGIVQWEFNGVAVSTSSRAHYSPDIASDGFGGAIITWSDDRVIEYSNDIYTQKVNANGKLGNTIGIFEQPGNERDFFLSQNYPNPFYESTTIKYKISNAQLVSLKVYTLLGKEIKTLVNSLQPAGTYEKGFDASQFSPGIYIYKLQVGSSTLCKKMLLMR
jgi:predicted lipoprotein with Yx(FWY)xxD motif